MSGAVLTPDEQAMLARAVARVQVHVAGELAASRSGAADAADAVIRLHRAIDAATARADARGPRPDCSARCAHCCSAPVTVAEAEARVLAAAVAALPSPRRAAVQAALAEGAAARARDPGARRPCALLDDGLCSVYDARPSSCRKAHSLSEPACRAGAATLPQDLARLLEVEALTLGSLAAWRGHGLPAAVRELQAAVVAALAAQALDPGTPLATVGRSPADPSPP
jgi:uncharacterized protein